MSPVSRPLPYIVPFLKLFTHKSKCRPIASLIELPSQCTRNIIPKKKNAITFFNLNDATEMDDQQICISKYLRARYLFELDDTP
jgi:hypothetical protein